MGLNVGGIVSGLRDTVKDKLGDGVEFAKHVAGAAKDKAGDAGKSVVNSPVVQAGLDKGTELAGKVVGKGLELLPREAENAALGAAERVIDVGAKVVKVAPGVPGKVEKLADDRVDEFGAGERRHVSAF